MDFQRNGSMIIIAETWISITAHPNPTSAAAAVDLEVEAVRIMVFF